VFWRLMPFLMLCYVVSYLDRVNIGFAKLQMLDELGLSETVFGLGSGIFFIGYFLFAVPSNMILHRIGARTWIAAIMVVWGLISALFVFVSNAPQFYALRFLLGLAESGFYPGIIFYLTSWFPAKLRARTIAMFMSAIPVASIFGNPLSGYIMDAMHGQAMSGWKWMFLIEAVPALILGGAVLLYLDNSVAAARWLNGEEKQALAQALDVDAKAQAAKAATQARLASPTGGWIWLMAFIYFCFVLGQYGLTFWMPTLVKAAGVVGNFHIGLVSALPFVFTLIVMNLLGRSADRRRERRWHLAIPALVSAAGFVVSGMSHNPIVAIGALCFAAAGAISCAPLFWSLPTAILSGAGAAAGIGLINSMGNVAGFVAPFLIGYIKDATGHTALGLYLIAAVVAAGAGAALAVPAKLVNR
jgi:MFS family permease